MKKAIELLENWLENEEQYADSSEELQDVKEVKEAVAYLEKGDSEMKVEDLGGFNELEDEANQEFYNYEDRAYPNGDSPLSDEHRALFITAWVLGFNTRR